MTLDRRNPYVILGLPFGASEEDARAGFARARRRLRTRSDAPYTDEDLTWALHQIEQLIANPELSVDVYRIPANPESAGDEARGLFNPAPHRLPRKTESDDAQWEGIRRQALAHAFRRIATPSADTQPRLPYE